MTPDQSVINAIEDGITQVTRRVEFYEADGVTPWYPNGSEEDTFRLTGGNISVDSSRAERRSIDGLFNNKDNALRPNADNGMWYDKIVRPYRGVNFYARKTPPKILIIEATGGYAQAAAIRSILQSVGFPDVTINLSATQISDLSGYRIILADGDNGAITKGALLQQAYGLGYSIFTKGMTNGLGEIPYVLSETAITNAAALTITPRLVDTPLAGGWSAENESSANGTGILTLRPTAVGIATSLNNAVTHYTASLEDNGNGRWFDYKPRVVGTQAKALWALALTWLWKYSAYQEWETPLGDFLIDTLNTKRFPHLLSVSGRDLTKKCLTSKLEKNMSFDQGTSTNALITALAANAGITKINLDPGSDSPLPKRIDAARGTERWSVMQQAANSLHRSLYFDIDGYLVHSPYADPTLGSPFASFKTGADGGNLADWDRSTSDERIYNHIVVTGDASDSFGESNMLGFFGEAENTNPNSPTRIAKLGDRTYFYNSPFFTSDAQCVAYAKVLLTQTAFEQYEIDFSSFVYPWMDAGVVIDFVEPDALSSDPTRFLMDTLKIPLGLEAMPASAKRVLFIDEESVAA